MPRRRLWLPALAALAVGLACGPANSSQLSPNIVLIISDDHGWPDYGFMGHPVVRTPFLDRLASESMVYTRGYVPAPVCRPSLATIATGLYPHQHRITGNDPPGKPRDPANRADMEEVFASNLNVMEVLARSGYSSHQSGKWWEGDPVNHGFDEAMTHGVVSNRGRHGDDGLAIGREGMGPVFEFARSRLGRSAPQSDVSAGEGPFFVWYAPFLPHTPHNPPERLLEKYLVPGRAPRVAQYYAMVEWLDETVGQLLDFLDGNYADGSVEQDPGVLERLRNTVVLYVADNGWIAEGNREDQPTSRAKMSPYDMGVRTPIMIRWPGRVAPSRDDRSLASSIDIVPTVLEAAGVETVGDLPGISLLDRDALSRRKQVFGSTFAHTSVDVRDPAANVRYRTVVREDGWKLVLPCRANRDVTLLIRGDIPDWLQLEPELYNVLGDPHETNNLAAERPELVGELRAALNEWWAVPD